MPELPEVETVRRGLQPALEGATIERLELRRGGLRVPFSRNFAVRAKGRRITALRRRAKYLLAELDDGTVLLMHLGMSGSFRIETEGKKDTKPVADGAVIDTASKNGRQAAKVKRGVKTEEKPS